LSRNLDKVRQIGDKEEQFAGGIAGARALGLGHAWKVGQKASVADSEGGERVQREEHTGSG
jgi:hypothetical protein